MRDLKNICHRDYKNEFDQRDNVHILLLISNISFCQKLMKSLFKWEVVFVWHLD